MARQQGERFSNAFATRTFNSFASYERARRNARYVNYNKKPGPKSLIQSTQKLGAEYAYRFEAQVMFECPEGFLKDNDVYPYTFETDILISRGEAMVQAEDYFETVLLRNLRIKYAPCIPVLTKVVFVGAFRSA